MSCIICTCARVEASTLEKRKQLLQAVYAAGEMTPLFYVCDTCKREMYEHEHSPEGEKLYEPNNPVKDSGTS